MQPINAISLTPDVCEWLANTRHPRILHVFDHACNLINERREVLSIVAPQIGNGPFNLVVRDDDVLFSERLNLQSLISNSPNHLNLGNLAINIADAKLWSPRPNWKELRNKMDDILVRLILLPITNYQVYGLNVHPRTRGYLTTTNPQSLITNSLISSIATADIPSSKIFASQLAGLGIGLTPSGDDFIMGAILAAWIIHPPEAASVLAKEIANIAAPLTTSLSAAWLKSAGRGEAGILWHQFFDALVAGYNIQVPITNLLAVGETSGADALAGFFGVCISFKERIIDKCPS